MSDQDRPDSRGNAPIWIVIVGQAAVVAALAFVLVEVRTTSREAFALRADVARLEAKLAREAGARAGAGATGPSGGDAVPTLEEKVDATRTDIEFLASDIQRLERSLNSLTSQLENRGQISSAPPQPADLDWTQPELFEAARKGADSVGIALTKDEVRVPARLILKEGLLEYFAVLKGGKEHESLFSIVGSTQPDARRPKDLGIKLNNAIQALGFPRGKPIRFTPNGTQAAQGDTIRIYVEWTTKGAKEIVRAEDLIWHKDQNRPMNPGSFVFVGSTFVPGENAGELDFAADLTAECVATYSAPSTMIDNTEKDAQDDTVFLVATPRIPDDVDVCTLVFRRTELDGVKKFGDSGASGGK